jgi:hypothetical protein
VLLLMGAMLTQESTWSAAAFANCLTLHNTSYRPARQIAARVLVLQLIAGRFKLQEGGCAVIAAASAAAACAC